MRLGLVWVHNANANYRAIEPLKAMSRRGHDVVWPADGRGVADPRRLAGCDVVHVYRRSDAPCQRAVMELLRRGTAIVFDDDDDFTMIPKDSPAYRDQGGAKGQRTFRAAVGMARRAYAFTTPSPVLAAQYRRAGVKRVEVIGNHLALDARDPLMRPDGVVVGWAPEQRPLRPRVRHDGLVIGWIAGLEHRVDARRLGIADTLARLVSEHEAVRVECIGVDLRLPSRYRHFAKVPFGDVPARIGGFDIGIAPLADIQWNRARSDIKLKEYAASGVPWLASPVGPYAELGEAQGGRLVSDDGWYQALERLVTHPEEREQLGRNGQAWARQQTIDAVADRWEALFTGAADRSRPSPAPPGR